MFLPPPLLTGALSPYVVEDCGCIFQPVFKDIPEKMLTEKHIFSGSAGVGCPSALLKPETRDPFRFSPFPLTPEANP